MLPKINHRSLLSVRVSVSLKVARGQVGAAMATKAHLRNPKKEAALHRLLQRGPAFRASSFFWTAQVLAGGESVAASASSRLKPVTVIGVKVFRSKRPAILATRFARYEGELFCPLSRFV